VPDFQVMAVLARVQELRDAGRDVVSLCAGEPSGGAAEVVNRAAAEVHASGEALTYTPAAGLPELRTAIAGHYQRWYGVDVDPAEVVVTTGASGAFLLTFLAAFDAGARVALARPGYPAYRNILSALDLDVLELPAGHAERYQPTPALLDAAEAEHGHLDGLVVASPANPTGTMLSRADLAALHAWCAQHGTLLISDEIYHGITYPTPGAEDPRGTTTRALGTDTVVVNSFSKYWGMPGWRLGWALLPQRLRGAATALAGNVSLCPPAAAQRAAVHCFDESAYAFGDEQVAGFARTRELLAEALPRLGWGTVAPADGAFYLYADIAPVLGDLPDAAAWCSALLEEEGVALTPGADFDAVGGRTAVRLSFAAGYSAVATAIERILAFQARHVPR